MDGKMTGTIPGGRETHQAKLERGYIEEFLKLKDYTFESLKDLPEDVAKQLMIEASRYASMKLAEHEARAKLRQQIRIG